MRPAPAMMRLRDCAKELGIEKVAWNTDAPAVIDEFYGRLVKAVRGMAGMCLHGGDVAHRLLSLVLVDHRAANKEVDRLDCDDGWPRCRVLNAVKALHCAQEFADAQSRWLAECAITIGVMVEGEGSNGWRREAKAWAAIELQRALAKGDGG